MFKKLFGFGQKSTPRQLTSVDQLEKGDIITFKHRQILPETMQGASFEVIHLASYQYDNGSVKELTLANEQQQSYFLSLEQEDGVANLVLSLPLSRSQVLSVFNADDFAQLWEPGYCQLSSQHIPAELAAWMTNSYQQTINEGEAYFYQRDLTQQAASLSVDDDGEPLRYHECAGEDDHYGLSVEVWADGTTDVAAVIYCPIDVIEEFHPHG